MTRRTRAQTRAKQMAAAGVNLQSHGVVQGNNTNPASNNAREATMADIVRGETTVSNTGLVTSAPAVDADKGDAIECAGCNRPNNAERYRVQCKKCTKWYHLTCAEMSSETMLSDVFTCVKCIPPNPVPPPSSVAGRSSNSSTRIARLARELELLEEERRMQEEAQREQLERERLLNERAAKEKLERDMQYLARKRDLLILQEEEDEVASLRSIHSNRATAKRVEDWVVDQANEASHVGANVVVETSKPAEPTHHTPVQPVEAPVAQRTSTPIQDEVLGPFHPQNDPAYSNNIKLTAGSITTGENEDPLLTF